MASHPRDGLLNTYTAPRLPSMSLLSAPTTTVLPSALAAAAIPNLSSPSARGDDRKTPSPKTSGRTPLTIAVGVGVTVAVGVAVAVGVGVIVGVGVTVGVGVIVGVGVGVGVGVIVGVAVGSGAGLVP